MSPLRRTARKAPILDIIDSSSQASEDNVPPEESPRTNRVVLHYAAENPDKLEAKTNSHYEMFSRCSLLSSPAPIKMLARRKRTTVDKGTSDRSKKRTSAKVLVKNKISKMKAVSREGRDESPLFEPEDGWGMYMQNDVNADTVMLSPRMTLASNDRLTNRQKGQSVAVFIRGNRSKRPIIVESESSSSDSESNTDSNIVVSMQSNPRSEMPLGRINLSSLSGDDSLIEDYIDNLDELAAEDAAIGARKRFIDELANEESAIALVIEGLPAEEKHHLASVARACAKGIQADMATPSIATDTSAIQAAMEKRNREAEVLRQSVPGMMVKREEE
ncbi:hypothetical protein G6011_04838 [Alternaria panax]|uniref:Uncharacterized protein n=1 Tax=Alternaria panax TaxID=48097 RepID=A0AAD4IHY7_9PLEO|nr:hypothetical protein G6011_04838 [Alternaria panax]